MILVKVKDRMVCYPFKKENFYYDEYLRHDIKRASTYAPYISLNSGGRRQRAGRGKRQHQDHGHQRQHSSAIVHQVRACEGHLNSQSK